MEIRDNGRGITGAEISGAKTMGLLGMRERARALGGEMRIGPAPRGGTQLLVLLPDRERPGA
jgi:two-component system sensor histidine kinase DegS